MRKRFGQADFMSLGLYLAEHRMAPDFLVRMGIRNLLRKRLTDCQRGGFSSAFSDSEAIRLESLKSPIALHTEESKAQHYEVPTGFFLKVLGPCLKYSACQFHPEDFGGLSPISSSLGEAERRSLNLVCERAKLEDGQRILELGCGWGSLTLWMAEKYPNSRITGVSHSRSQREFIISEAQRRGLGNIEIITSNINDFQASGLYDRIVSIEMFEHIRNHSALFFRMASWLKSSGLLFVHIFIHKEWTYLFETEGEDNWMGKYFFTGGIMMSPSYFMRSSEPFCVRQVWYENGMHYACTARAWLNNLDRSLDQIAPLFLNLYGSDYKLWIQRWRIFFMSCEELFAFNSGNEWGVGHFLFTKV